MRIRFKITIIFAFMVSAILSLVCISVYYFSSLSRVQSIKTRLTNRAITTARLLSQSTFFDKRLLRKIDTATALAMKDKTIQVYDYLDQRIYWYSDKASDTIPVEKKILDDARIQNNLYFSLGKKDMIAHHFVDHDNRVVIIAAAYDEDGKKNLQQLNFILWVSLAGGIIACLITGHFFSGRLLAPIRKITNEVKEISARNLTSRVKTGRIKDEWHYLSATLNELLNRLQESFEIQGRFISNASHELSTPLTVISSQLEVALQRERDVDEYRRTLISIGQDVHQLSRLTRALLEFAKASGSPEGLNIDLVRMDEILLEVASQIRKMNDNYAVFITFDQPPSREESLIVAGNRELLFSAIKNIVSNACKFSENHSAKINLIAQHSDIIVEIHDDGNGIPTDEIGNIFQPFYRTEESRAEPGFGIGLSLADRIIKLHKGNIHVKSTVGEGTVFIVTLPVAGSFLRS